MTASANGQSSAKVCRIIPESDPCAAVVLCDKEAESGGGLPMLPVRVTVAASLLLVVAGLAAVAQDPLQLKVDVQITALDVYVDDATGKPITNLTREDFTILE